MQAKFATGLGAGVSAGLSLAAGWLARARPRYQASSVVGLLTWMAAEALALH